MSQNPSTARPVSNSAFLTELARGARKGTTLWVAAFRGSPDLTEASNWAGAPYGAASARVDTWDDRNTYYSVASLRPSGDGEVRRRRANFDRLLALVVDDIDPEDIHGRVTYLLRTSPGKLQAGIFIDAADPDAADAALVDRLVTSMVEHGLLRADSAGNNAVRYVRLPVGSNLKPRDSGPWPHELATWAPDVRLSLADAAAAFGVDLDTLRKAPERPEAPRSEVAQGELLRTLTAAVLRGEILHDGMNRIAASLVATGMPGGAVVNHLRALMDCSLAARDERWAARYADIPRAVSTAEEKFRPEPQVKVESSELVLDMAQLSQRAGLLKWAVKGIIPQRGIGFIYGASGTFKSFLALDYALHRVYGLPWLGRKTVQGNVVYLAAEGGAGLLRRIQAWHKDHGMDWTTCPMRVVITPLTLRTEATVLREAILETGLTNVGDVIVDTMSQTYSGSENSNDEVAEWMRIVGLELRDALDCNVLIIHHSGHVATERPRGASAILANADYCLGVFRDGAALISTVEFAKIKDSDRPPDALFALARVVIGTDEDGDEITSLAASWMRPADALRAELSQARAAVASGDASHYDRLLTLISAGSRVEDVRRQFYEGMPGAQPETRKKAWQRALHECQDRGYYSIQAGVFVAGRA